MATTKASEKAPAKKTAPVKKTAPATKTAPAKKAAPAKKVAPAKKTAPVKKTAPATKTAATKKITSTKSAFAKLEAVTKKLYKKEVAVCDNQELYYALLKLAKDEMAGKPQISGKKKVYYISAEFLIGKLLSNNLINLGIYDELNDELAKVGKTLSAIEEAEPEPSLGNGGLGRLAACFLDSIASLNLPGDGIGLNYHFGLFKQEFHDNKQVAVKNEWIEDKSWLTKTKTTFSVNFGKMKVKSRLYDIDVIGYKTGTNKLHLFDIESIDESIVEDGINFDKEAIKKNLTLFLYPDDSDEAGNLLRIYQQYFMVSNGAQLILKEMKESGYDLHELHKHAAIQINDTHPSMVIPELIRILTSEEGFSMDEAIKVVSKTCAYTNHTILAEALEKWPLDYLKKVVPQLVPIIEELAARVQKKYKNKKVWIIDDNNRVHMAHIDIHYGYSVNGVAALHTEILKNTELHHFYEIYPKKFNNKTNGITFRRWLLSCNHELADYITELIGEGYKTNANELEKLMKYADDKAVLEKLAAIKMEKKQQLIAHIKENENVELDPNSIFDIQIKRMHEYKRQQMNALYIIHKYLEIKKGKVPKRPISFIFGAKAAPAYIIAQDIIHLLLCMQEIINKDPKVNKYMKLVFVTNYNVSYAEKLIPACDISEQISLASKEASGTGNMKFMLNGAVTLGTEDGANVEIHQLVGDDNIFIFGKDSDTVIENYAKNAAGKNGYVSKKFYEKDAVIKEAVDFIISDTVKKVGDEVCLNRLYNELINKDWFMTLLDLKEYIRVKDKALNAYEKKNAWRKMMLVNIAKAGFFSSDRTIAEYNKDIWKLK
ncbi:MAG: glycogen/starch/alpha-glucan phosphorylase [Lachnospiraceae bacterium]